MQTSENMSSLSQNKRKYESYVRVGASYVTSKIRHLKRMNTDFSKLAVSASGKLILHVTCLRKLVI